jgi:quinol monooxygenase YgiN
MTKVSLVARFVAKPGKEEELKSLLKTLIEPTRTETGCEIYDLYESPENGRFFFWELWTSQEALDSHGQTPHIQKMRAKVSDLLTEPAELSILKAVDNKEL